VVRIGQPSSGGMTIYHIGPHLTKLSRDIRTGHAPPIYQ